MGAERQSGGDWVYLNGSILPRADAAVSAMDRGFLYGDGFFETVRIVAGTPFRLGAHIARMAASCRETDWGWAPDARALAEAVAELVRRNGAGDGYLRITVSRGPHAGALTKLDAPAPTVFVDAHPMDLPPLDDPPPFVLSRAAHRRNETSPAVRHKSLSYLENVLALAEARARGADEVYLLNSRGHLAEGAITNLFLVRGGTVLTPDVCCGLLPGITRAVVLEICAREGIAAAEGEYGEDELARADEIFCTNSLRGIVPVRAVLDLPGRQFDARTFTARIQRLYAGLVRAEV